MISATFTRSLVRAYRLDSYKSFSVRLLQNSPSLSSSAEEKPTAPGHQNETKKALHVAIVGLPNAGKSQLLNMLIGETVAAVSRKRHTTRDGVLGARVDGNTQLCFMDTPGFLRTEDAKKEGLQRDLVVTAASAMEYVDYTLLVVDAARKLTEDYKATLVSLMLQALQANGRIEWEDDDEEFLDENEDEEIDDPPKQMFSVVLNKSDLIWPKKDMLDLAFEIGDLAEECLKLQLRKQNQQLTGEALGEILIEVMPTFFYVSSTKNRGVNELRQFLLDKATPCKEWEVNEGQTTSMTPQERVHEILREKAYRCLHKEVPHSIQYRNKMFKILKDQQGKPGLMIHEELMVRTKSHQELVHGSGGRTLERIRETAERDLKKIFHCEVVLQLQVKLVKSKNRNWSI